MEQKTISKELPVIPVVATVVIPNMTTKLRLSDAQGKRLRVQLSKKQSFAIALTIKNEDMIDHLTEESFYKVGCMVHIDSIQKSDKGYLAYSKVLKRIKIEKLLFQEPGISASYTFFPLKLDMDEANRTSLMSYIIKIIKEISRNFQNSSQFIQEMKDMKIPEEVVGLILPLLSISTSEKQEFLEIDSERQMGIRFIDMLLSQKNSIELQIEIAQKFNEKLNKNHRDTLLRQQMKAIQDELGDHRTKSKSKKDYRVRIEEAMMPEEVREVAFEQVDKLEVFGKDSHEAGGILNYLDLLLSLPWQSEKSKPLDIDTARTVLKEDHYGLEKVKTRIIQHLAVMKLKNDKKGSIILLVGPPGTGKTSLGKSIARAMDRKYFRLSLGGIRDEAEIRGHRRTYIGALPGRIIQGMKKVGVKNPVFVLDEVDKLMVGYSGDPASALLEVLDPEQNNTFVDHYLEIPYDLSEVFFIATANTIGSIPEPLLDRMEVLELSGYTATEKFEIAKNHLINLVLEDHGLDSKKLHIEDDAFNRIITEYTKEAGVRGLKKELAKIARVVSEKIVSGTATLPFIVKQGMVVDILGKSKVNFDRVPKRNIPGVVTGLAWTSLGGDILFIECSLMAGKGELILTGQLGNVMKESARISMSLIQSRLVHLLHHFDFSKNDIHIHVPSGAIPKDGPSAGITLFTTLASLLLNKSIDSKLAMTGEITLRGSVLPVGGIKEKVLAAHRAGIRSILLPRKNEEDIKEIPKEVLNDLKCILIDTIEDVVDKALRIKLPKPVFYTGEAPLSKAGE